MIMGPQAKRKLMEWLTLLFWIVFVAAFIYLIIFVKGIALTSSTLHQSTSQIHRHYTKIIK